MVISSLSWFSAWISSLIDEVPVKVSTCDEIHEAESARALSLICIVSPLFYVNRSGLSSSVIRAQALEAEPSFRSSLFFLKLEARYAHEAFSMLSFFLDKCEGPMKFETSKHMTYFVEKAVLYQTPALGI